MKSRPRLSLEEDSGIDNSSKNSRGPTGPQGLMGGDDDRLNKLLQEKLEMKRRLKQREYERLAKKSYILNKPETRDEISKRSPEYSKIQYLEGELDELVKTSKRKELYMREMNESSVFSLDRFNYFVHKNPFLITNLLLECNLLILTYPLQTLKTRMQSKHKTQDLCHFMKNQVEKAPMHYGLANAYAQALSGSFVHYFTARYLEFSLLKSIDSSSHLKRKLLSYVGADMLSAPFRLYFEIRKNLRQMNVPEITVGKLSSSFRLALLPFVLKDLVFRTSFESFYHSAIFFEYYSKLNKQRKLGIPVIDTFGSMMEFESQQGIHRRSGFFILGAAFAAVLTNPLDMITTRLIIQQKSAYSGMIDCAKTIIKEEGIGKLLISGFGARTGFLALHGSLMMALTPRVLPLVQQAYSIENLIN